MIVRERPDEYVFITQHDHAQLSGWFAVQWGNTTVPAPSEPNHALLFAAAMHDLGWIRLDESPLWNDQASQPYSFLDEPLDRKLPQYVAGIDQIGLTDPYAALLCSRHYASFFPSDRLAALGADAARFVAGERSRQEGLKDALAHSGRTAELQRADPDLALLKLWDHLSLYVALNEPGASKSEEHPWYRDGFPKVTLDVAGETAANNPGAPGTPSGVLELHAHWVDQSTIILTPYPLAGKRSYALPFRRISKAAIANIGLLEAYRRSQLEVQVVTFEPEHN